MVENRLSNRKDMKKITEEHKSRELTNLSQEIIDLKDKLGKYIEIESKKLVDQEILTMSTDLDRLIVEYLKVKNGV